MGDDLSSMGRRSRGSSGTNFTGQIGEEATRATRQPGYLDINVQVIGNV